MAQSLSQPHGPRRQEHVYYGIGKVFDAGSLFAAYTGDPKVAARTQYIIDELVKSRDADGYLGFWNVEPENRQDHINWILHEQEYINLALVRNYRCTGNPQSLAHAKVMGDYILKTFPTPQNPCYDAGEICTAGLPEGMLELYRVTGDKRYFDFAADVPHGNNRGEVQLASLRTWEQDFSRPPRHVYVMLARCYAQTELYRLTGEENLLHMSQFMRNELLKQGEGGMLVTGSCSDGEQFTYDQNGRGAIGESCVTAYVLRWIDSLLRLEGDMRYGDLLERTIYNALLAANSPDGRWIRYFTPFTGDRQYDTRDFFCCCGNYRRAVAELPQKVYYRTPEGGIALNLFTNSKKAFDVKGQTVTILQETAYPNDGEVKLTFSTQEQKPVAFAFQFRTPRWCEKITLRVNDEAPVTIDPLGQKLGCYVLNRTWKDGDVVKISMPMAWRFLRGRAVQDGRVVLLRGPMVYCIGKDQNAELLAKCPEPRNLVIDPASIAEPVRDDSIRPQRFESRRPSVAESGSHRRKSRCHPDRVHRPQRPGRVLPRAEPGGHVAGAADGRRNRVVAERVCQRPRAEGVVRAEGDGRPRSDVRNPRRCRRGFGGELRQPRRQDRREGGIPRRHGRTLGVLQLPRTAGCCPPRRPAM